MTSQSCAVIDTSCIIDAFKMGLRRQVYDDIRKGFDWTITTDIAQLEFKAVIIQEMITIHAELRRIGRFTVVRDYFAESNHRQKSLRMHIFNNYIDVHGSSLNVDEAWDHMAAEQARLLLETLIPELYEDFSKMIDSIHKIPIECNRAVEPPRFRRRTFATNLPSCRRGVNKSCTVETFIRERVAPNLDAILEVANAADSDQLRTAHAEMDATVAQADRELSHQECRRCGDCLISFAATGVATHSVSTNATEWEPLSKLAGLEFVHIKYHG